MARFGNKNRLGKRKPEAERIAQVSISARVPSETKDRWVSEAARTKKSVARLLIERAPPSVK
jgi:hypothetical protein